MADDESSVRVAVRIRPQIAREVIDMCRVCTTVTPGEPQVTLGSDKSFTYDYVFDMGQQQENIYETCARGLVDGSLEGYNATILAYGQTGSGKTYTMGTGFDVDLEPEQVGIIPRAINHLFDGINRVVQQAKETGEAPPQFKVSAQFLELYNEEIIDLFDTSQDYTLTKCKSGIKIHEDANHSIYVTGVTSVNVHNADEALKCLRQGALSRTTASTQMNSQSSRSHAIFTLHIKQQTVAKLEKDESETDENDTGASQEFVTLSAKFHFVDLAGSERLKRTGATGERAKEGISINCGLLALGNVISALGDKSKRALHVPYRDSKLTRLLQDSLGGNSRTVMIACVSPSDRDFMETLNTLKYANRARNIQNKVTINQDKSSRTISLLRQQIQELQLELLEYKQGKRVVGEDGEGAVNDMFHENTMLQNELSNLRTRVKAMQDTIDALSAKNIQLLAEKATGAWMSSEAGAEGDMTEMIQSYLKEIEELRAKLVESESVCQQLRRSLAKGVVGGRPPLPTSPSNGNVDSLIAQAKRDLQKDMEALARGKEALSELKKNGANEDSEQEESDEESESETESEEKDSEYSQELAELTSEINLKQKLIEELEHSQRRLHSLKQHYEDKLLQLQAKIRATQEERDTVLASFSGQNNQPTEKVKKVRDEYERKLCDMQKEVKKLQTAKKEHAKMLRNQSQYESQIKTLRNEVMDMKKVKVKLINKMREETARHKEMETKRNREIAQLRKESRKREVTIKSLEAEKRAKDVVLKRKQEEVLALRKVARGDLSRKAAGRFPPKLNSSSPRLAKQKWAALQKNINSETLYKQQIANLELELDRLVEDRKNLNEQVTAKERKLSELRLKQPRERVLIRDLEEEVESLRANLKYVEDSITESQQSILQLEESKDIGDCAELVSGMRDLGEASYIIEKLYNMTVFQSYMASQKEAALHELRARQDQLEKESETQRQLLEHIVGNPSKERPPNSSNSSNASSRSPSPTDNLNGNTFLSVNQHHSKSEKYRKRTAPVEELLYANVEKRTIIPSLSPEHMPPPARALTRVPSAPTSLKTLSVKPEPPVPSPVLGRKALARQDSTSPRPVRRGTFVLPPGTSLARSSSTSTSMEQGLDVSPPSSPPPYRRATSRDENVFSRLTSGTMQSNDTQMGNGIITTYQGKVGLRAPLVCTHVAEGHSRAVLAVAATDDLLFTASRDRTVKVWDLTEGKESQTLGGHPNNVVTVKYDQETRLLYSVSTAYVRVWDLRTAKCIRTLCSSGSSTNGIISGQQIPSGEAQMNDIALNHNGRILYTAASDRVRVWDVRKFAVTGKLSGGHQAAVMCLAVGKLSAHEDIVVTGSKDHYIKVFEVAGEEGGMFSPRVNLEPPHYDGIQSLAIRGHELFSGSRDSIIKKWDLDKQELITSVSNAHKDWVCGLAYIPGQPLLVSVCRGGVLKLWSSDNCQLLGEMKAHDSPINAITTNNSHLFTAANCGEVKIWRAPQLPNNNPMTMSTGRVFQLSV
ncbi:kinesin-like protein KIF21A [Macrosteles quadrilineatus]|uniref:kinesin-like protein KIF21A n=1 Tax=Macrosteles quadrilineatus TaxID=74068 RepID=UPI0023E0FF75|nr:kinesin-like protein KIF21A [Macrosteles quadrilineatus]